MAPIPVGPVSDHPYTQWLDVVHPNTEGTSTKPIEQTHGIDITPTNGCQDNSLHDLIICVQHSLAGNLERRNVTQSGDVEKSLEFSYTGWLAHQWDQIMELLSHSRSKGKTLSKRESSDDIHDFFDYLAGVARKIGKYFYNPNPPEYSLWGPVRNTTTPSIEGDKKHQKRGQFDDTAAKVYHKLDDWLKSSGHKGVAVDWKRGFGVQRATQNMTRDSSKKSGSAHIALHGSSRKPLNRTRPLHFLNSTLMGKIENSTRQSNFSRLHFVEAQPVGGRVPLGIPNYALAFGESGLDKLVGCFFLGVFGFVGVKWGLEAFRARRNRI